MTRRFLAAVLALSTLFGLVAVQPVAAAAPGVPTGVTAAPPVGLTVSVSFTAPADNGGSAITSYEVTSSPGGITAAGAASPLVVRGLAAGTAYTFTVTATNGDPATSGSSAPSNQVTTPTVPSAPAAPTVVPAGASGIRVDWVAPATGGSPLTAFRVTLTASAGGPAPATFITANGTTLTHTFTGVAAGTYTARVVAVNLVGNGPASPASGAIVLPPVPGQPAAPTVSAAGLTGIKVDWAAPATGGVPTIYKVTLTASAGGPAPATFTTANASTFTHTFAGLPSGTYTARVVAANATGDGAASSASAAIVISGTPGVPVVTATAVSVSQINVSWTQPANNGSVITSYAVSISPADGTIGAINQAARTVSITGLKPATDYTVSVTATNAIGTGTAGQSPETTTQGSVPGSPTGVSVVLTDKTTARVTFTAPGNAGGVALGDYTVTAVPRDGSLATITKSGGTSPIDLTGLSVGATYDITVKASNVVGSSPASAAVVLAVPDVPGLVANVVGVNQTPFSSTVVVTWKAPADNGGSAVTGYRISLGGQTKTAEPTTFSVTFTGVAVGEHPLTIIATTIAGDGPVATGPSIEVRSFPPFNTEQALIRQLYRDFLGREADSGGLTYWAGVTANDGSNVSSVARSFMFSPEFAPRRAITRLYLAFFDRRPDIGGMDFWAGQINSRQANLDTISNSFVGSNEFQTTYGSLTDRDFIRLVYNNVLVRQPDQDGYDFWLGRMANGMTRGQLMTQFSESPEFVGATRPAVDVIVTYRGMLNRQPDDAGFVFWLGQIAGNADAIEELIGGFYNSPEYADRIAP